MGLKKYDLWLLIIKRIEEKKNVDKGYHHNCKIFDALKKVTRDFQRRPYSGDGDDEKNERLIDR